MKIDVTKTETINLTSKQIRDITIKKLKEIVKNCDGITEHEELYYWANDHHSRPYKEIFGEANMIHKITFELLEYLNNEKL